MNTKTAALAGSVVASVLASVCCIVPLAFAMLGLTGAAFAVRLEPLRPYLLLLTYSLLGGAFYLTYRPGKVECGPGEACELPTAARAGRAALWITAVIVVVTTAFPLYSAYLF